MNDNNKLSQAALDSLLRVWSVIPINPDTKSPYLDTWEEFQHRLPIKEEVTEWWTKWPNAAIGIVTGKISGFDAVDVDPRHSGTIEGLTPTTHYKTGGGGWHFLYKHTPGLHCRNGLRAGLDFKTTGGYVIFPPSPHKSGNYYEWVVSPDEADFTELPAWIIEELKKNSPQNSKWKDNINGTNEGERNETGSSVVGKLFSVFHKDQWESLCWPLLKGWNLQNTPPLPEDELRIVFESIAKKELANRESVLGASSHLYKDGSAMQWKEPVSITSLSTEKTPMDWIWEGFLAKSHLTELFALFKAGKTTFFSWLLKNLQSSDGFVGKALKPCKVLIISEESEAKWAQRREAHQLSDGIWVVCRPVSRRLSYQEWLNFLQKIFNFCKEKEIELLVIDTISTFWPVEKENDATQVTNALLPFNTFLNHNLAVLTIHHSNKAGGEEGTASRGSGAFTAQVDIVVEFRRFDPARLEDTRRVIKTYSRFDETPREIVVELTNEGYTAQGTKAQVIQAEKMDVLLELLPIEPEGWTIKKLTTDWPTDEYGNPPHKTTFHRWLTRLSQAGNSKIIGKSNEKGNPDLWARPVALQPSHYNDATGIVNVPRLKEIEK